jgi:gamma-glutamyltranspeptidase/glutathione hydrolase
MRLIRTPDVQGGGPVGLGRMVRTSTVLLGCLLAAACAGRPASAPETASAPAISVSTPVTDDLATSTLEAAPSAPGRDAVYPTVAVASDHPEASAIGAAILAAGGNAADAAVATGLALGILNPFASGIGGGGFLLWRDGETGEVVALDFREVAPGAAHADMFAPEAGVAADASLFGGLAIAVPGEAAGWWALHQRFGRLPWAQVVAPALDLAQNEFAVGPLLDQRLREAPRLAIDGRFFHRIWGHDGDLYGSGNTMPLYFYAEFLELYAAGGAPAFYTGDVAESLVDSVQGAGGILTLEDLAAYEVVWREPLEIVWAGQTLYTMPPVSSGGVVLQQSLTAWEQLGFAPEAILTPAGQHGVLHTWGFGFADRARLLGDPAFVDPAWEAMLAPARLLEIVRSFDATTALPLEAYGELIQPSSDDGTSHFSIVDADGNAVACTTTINTAFGAHVADLRYEFILNNQMDDFAARPGVPNAFGLPGAEANRIEPGKRPLSSMTPTIVVRDGELQGVLGGSGGPHIITATQLVLMRLTAGVPVGEAVSGPRFHFQWLPFSVFAEPGIDRDALAALGWVTEERGFSSAVQAIWRVDGGWSAASDPRKLGAPAGW